jgi:hypothetical protein
VRMKELDGAEVRGTVRSRRAGEIRWFWGWAGNGHGAGGRRTGRMGGGKGRSFGAVTGLVVRALTSTPPLRQSAGRAGALPSRLEIGKERAAAC